MWSMRACRDALRACARSSARGSVGRPDARGWTIAPTATATATDASAMRTVMTSVRAEIKAMRTTGTPVKLKPEARGMEAPMTSFEAGRGRRDGESRAEARRRGRRRES